MKLRMKSIVSASERLTLSPLLPAAAVMLVTLFAWSLAQAARVDGNIALATRAPIAAGNIAVKALSADGATDREAAVFSAPVETPDQPAPYRIRIRETN